MEIEFKNILIQNSQWTSDAYTDSGVFVCTINLDESVATEEELQAIKNRLLESLSG